MTRKRKFLDLERNATLISQLPPRVTACKSSCMPSFKPYWQHHSDLHNQEIEMSPCYDIFGDVFRFRLYYQYKAESSSAGSQLNGIIWPRQKADADADEVARTLSNNTEIDLHAFDSVSWRFQHISKGSSDPRASSVCSGLSWQDRDPSSTNLDHLPLVARDEADAGAVSLATLRLSANELGAAGASAMAAQELLGAEDSDFKQERNWR
jgi:hypothetical protein